MATRAAHHSSHRMTAASAWASIDGGHGSAISQRHSSSSSSGRDRRRVGKQRMQTKIKEQQQRIEDLEHQLVDFNSQDLAKRPSHASPELLDAKLQPEIVSSTHLSSSSGSELDLQPKIDALSAEVRDMRLMLNLSIQREAAVRIAADTALASSLRHGATCVTARAVAHDVTLALHSVSSSNAYSLVTVQPVGGPACTADSSHTGADVLSTSYTPQPQQYEIFDADDLTWTAASTTSDDGPPGLAAKPTSALGNGISHSSADAAAGAVLGAASVMCEELETNVESPKGIESLEKAPVDALSMLDGELETDVESPGGIESLEKAPIARMVPDFQTTVSDSLVACPEDVIPGRQFSYNRNSKISSGIHPGSELPTAKTALLVDECGSFNSQNLAYSMCGHLPAEPHVFAPALDSEALASKALGTETFPVNESHVVCDATAGLSEQAVGNHGADSMHVKDINSQAFASQCETSDQCGPLPIVHGHATPVTVEPSAKEARIAELRAKIAGIVAQQDAEAAQRTQYQAFLHQKRQQQQQQLAEQRAPRRHKGKTPSALEAHGGYRQSYARPSQKGSKTVS